MRTQRKSTEVTRVYFKATCGSSIGDCIDECIIFSAKNKGVRCTLEHNEVEIEVSSGKLKAELIKEWNKKMDAS